MAEAGLVDRIAKGRAEGDAWLALERLLVVVAERVPCACWRGPEQ